MVDAYAAAGVEEIVVDASPDLDLTLAASHTISRRSPPRDHRRGLNPLQRFSRGTRHRVHEIRGVFVGSMSATREARHLRVRQRDLPSPGIGRSISLSFSPHRSGSARAGGAGASTDGGSGMERGFAAVPAAR